MICSSLTLEPCHLIIKDSKNKQNFKLESPFDEDLMQTRKIFKLPFAVE